MCNLYDSRLTPQYVSYHRVSGSLIVVKSCVRKPQSLECAIRSQQRPINALLRAHSSNIYRHVNDPRVIGYCPTKHQSEGSLRPRCFPHSSVNHFMILCLYSPPSPRSHHIDMCPTATHRPSTVSIRLRPDGITHPAGAVIYCEIFHHYPI